MKQTLQKALSSKSVLYLVSFIIPSYIMLIILFTLKFYPFGDKTLFTFDMKAQFIGFFAYLRNIFSDDNSPFFCWSRSMGGNFLGLFAYYLASPLSFLTCLFPIEKLYIAILLLTILKIGLCGVSFAVYADYMLGGSKKLSSYLIIWICSTSYALISYNIAYFLCLMLLDGVILLPTVLLGVEKLLNEKKGIHYTLCLATLFLCNYYTGYMVGIFTAIYFLYRLPKSNSKKYFHLGIRFGICTVLATGLSLPLLLPAVHDLTLWKLDGHASYSFSLTPNFAFSDFISKFRNGSYDGLQESSPFIYCGVVILVFAIIFFICRNVSLREKIGAIVILTLLFFSFYYNGLNLIWHGFQSPNGFPYRYSFLFSFFLVYMAFRAMCSLDADRNIFSSILSSRPALAGFSYMPLLLLLLTALADLTTNAQSLITKINNEYGYAKVEDYQSFLNKITPLMEWVRQNDNGLYRINSVCDDYSLNDAMLLGFHGMKHSSSTCNSAVISLTQKLGFVQTIVLNTGYGSTPLTDSLFSVSYRLSTYEEPDFYEKLMQSEEDIALYRNNMALPMVYAATVPDVTPDLSMQNPFYNQNILLQSITGKNETFFGELNHNYYNDSKNSWSYSFTAKSSNPTYLYTPAEIEDNADIYVNDVLLGNYSSAEINSLLYLGCYSPGQQVIVQVVPSKGKNLPGDALIASLDMDALCATLNELQAGGMEIFSHKSVTLSGSIFVEEGQSIITSIPYDKGWTVLVDGQKTDTGKFAGTFLMLSVPAGEHELYFYYISPGFYIGVRIFVISLIILLLFYIKGNSKVNQKIQKLITKICELP